MRWLLIIIATLLLVPVANAERNYKADLAYDGSTITGCGYTPGVEVYDYIFWYEPGLTGKPQDPYVAIILETDADANGCISIPWTVPGDGLYKMWAIEQTEHSYRTMAKITFEIGV